jgi:hypothetical protein
MRPSSRGKIRNSNFETSTNAQNSKFKTAPAGRAAAFWSLGFWYFEFVSDFVLRISDFLRRGLRISAPHG